MIPRLSTLLALPLAFGLFACEASVEQSAPGTDHAAGEATVDATIDTNELDFTLNDLDGNSHRLADYLAQGKTVVLEWFNPGCPYVQRYHDQGPHMKGFAEEAGEHDVVWLAINSGAPGKQGAGLELNREATGRWDVAYPVLLDETGEVGRLYGAQTTPHMFVITPDQGLIYQGAIDETGGKGPVGESYVTKALAEYAAGKPVTAAETKPFGCSVKYGD